jgi:putative membrane protein
MLSQHSKNTIAFIIALIAHVVAVIGIFSSHREWFIHATPYMLILMFVLLIFTQPGINKAFLVFVILTFIISIVAELVGVHTGFLFGQFEFGKLLGPTIKNVPWIIGINWFIVIYCGAVFTQTMYTTIEKKFPPDNLLPPSVQKFSIVLDGAFIITFFDWVLEPAVVKLGFWTWWTNGQVPVYNYVCWFLVSGLLLLLFELLNFKKQNQFAVHLFILQLLFFFTLRTFL